MRVKDPSRATAEKTKRHKKSNQLQDEDSSDEIAGKGDSDDIAGADIMVRDNWQLSGYV